jgi:type IV secretory pathway TrbD component
MSISDAWDLIALLSAQLWNKITTFSIFGIELWPFALFGIAMSFLGYIATRIIQRKGGNNGDSD